MRLNFSGNVLAATLALTTMATGPRPVYAGGGTHDTYCREAIERVLPFDRASKVWGMSSYQTSNGDLRILLCNDMGRIDVIPDSTYALGFIRVISGEGQKVKDGEKLLDALDCVAIREGEGRWTSEITYSQPFEVENPDVCNTNLERAGSR